MTRSLATLSLCVGAATVIGCSSATSSTQSDADYRAAVTTGMHDALATEIATFLQASKELQSAAPEPSGRGWDAAADAKQIAAMKEAWVRVRSASERIEGAIAPLFPEVDYAVDPRYDDFLSQLGAAGDPDLFDDQGVT